LIGIDIVDVSRIEAVKRRHGERFLRRIFTDSEIAYARSKRRSSETLAGRFAAKEAFMKAVGRRLPWREIEVLSGERGKPLISYKGEHYRSVSISHEKAYAIAAVTIEGEVKS
jgi:holo-[acyl-carrier protein] synthase